MTSHDLQVKKISEEVKEFYKAEKHFRIYHGSTNSTRTQNFKKGEIIDVSDLNHVLEVNTKEKYALIEPNIPMDKLVKELFMFGFAPPVVMELPGITAGGGIQGGAGESSSFKFGGFHECTEEYEIILGNGEIVTASPTKNSDLFYGTACSYGSVGIITKIKLNIVEAKPFIKLTYKKTTSIEESIKELEKSTKEKVDFIDGIIFSEDLATVMTGVFSEKEDLPISTFSKTDDEWFYLHAEAITKKNEIWTELIPLEEYFFRYNRGAFWVGKYAFKKLRLPFNKRFRRIMDPLMDTRVLYRFLQAINISQRQVVQDFCLPAETVVPFTKHVIDKTKIFPLWLLPMKISNEDDRLSPSYLDSRLGIDVGVWGKVPGTTDEIIQMNKDLEDELIKSGGRKVLYAHQYYSEENFWKIYDKKWYEELREKYHANKVFPNIYKKTKVKEVYDFSVAKGLWDVIKSPKKLPIS